MLGRLSHTRLLRATGLYTWALVGIPIILNVWFLPPPTGTEGQEVDIPLTMLAYFTFGACYWLATRSLGARSAQASGWNVPLALMLTLAAVAVGVYSRTGLSALLMVILAGVLP